MGRYWDDPGAKLLQKLGLGSVMFIPLGGSDMDNC
jgi:hypothetical protein